MRSVGEGDRAKLDQYSDAVRSVEQQIQVAEQQSSKELPDMEKPIGIPEKFSDYAKLMMDLQVLAFQGDMTRVSTFMFGHEMGGRAYPELGFGDQHHSLTHHQGDTAKIAKVLQINMFHTRLYQYFLERMRSVPDGDGSLLDHSLLVYGSPLSDGNMHLYKDLPVLLVAGGATGIRGGRHIRYPENTPMANLYLTLLDKLGIQIERFGDSTGRLGSVTKRPSTLPALSRCLAVRRRCLPRRARTCACSMRSGRGTARPFGSCCGITPMSMPLSPTAPPR